jgi:hypothetical protein
MLTVAVLLLRFVSRDVVATVAVSVMIVPAPAVTLTTTGKVLEPPGATLGFEQLMVGVKVEQDHPAGTGLSETNVVPAGMASVNVTLAQLLGPELVATWV